MLPRHRRARGALWLFVFFQVASCRPDRVDELRQVVPRLPPDIASHLVKDDPKKFERFARTHTAELQQANSFLTLAPPTTSMQDFLRVESFVDPYKRRLIDALASPSRLDANAAFYDAYCRLSAADRFEIVKLIPELAAVQADTSAPAERIASLTRLIERGKRYPGMLKLFVLYHSVASLLPAQQADEIRRYLELAVEDALAFPPDSLMACQLLGELGVHYSKLREREAMWRAWERGLACAHAIGSWQEARILSFCSIHYQMQGQFAIARDLLLDIQERCRDSDLPQMEIRFANDTVRFFIRLDCWDLVGNALRRAEITFSEWRTQLPPGDAELEGARLQGAKARYLAQIGRCDEAKAVALAVAKRVDGWALGPVRAGPILLDAARALARCGFAVEARPLLEHGFQQYAAIPVPVLIGKYAIELADVQLSMGELDACQKTLEAHHPGPADPEFVQHGIVRLRLDMARRDRSAAFATLQDVLQRLSAMEDEMDTTPEGYIVLAKSNALRRLGHELFDPSPEAGYGFEMRWRRPSSLGRRFADSLLSESDVVSVFASEARQTLRLLRDRDAVHCVYDVHDDAVVRFTADGTGISKARLECSPSDLRTCVQRVWEAIAKPSPDAGGLDPRLTEDLRQLGTWLLPESVLHPPSPRLFLVTANDCLSRLPFEILNLDQHAYIPLLERIEVASIRHWRECEPGKDDSALVVSEPVYSATLKRRYSILSEPLPASAVEASQVQKLFPLSTHLAGPAATKRNVVEHWGRAQVLYFAGHSVQDPVFPYAMFIPLSESPERHDDDSYLEISDVRRADLSHCRLVVLSSCSSGAPYLDRKVQAPSLADVFVDAGAWAAVSTRWSVRDDAAARVMDAFIRFYAQDEGDPIRALCRARREVAAAAKDPHIWAAYSITVGGLPGSDLVPGLKSSQRATTASRSGLRRPSSSR